MCSFYNYCVLFLNVPFNIPKIVGGFKKDLNNSSSNFYTLNEFNKFIKFVDDGIFNHLIILFFLFNDLERLL